MRTIDPALPRIGTDFMTINRCCSSAYLKDKDEKLPHL
jgi:hypothetical protein